jgi:hypothetical protein
MDTLEKAHYNLYSVDQNKSDLMLKIVLNFELREIFPIFLSNVRLHGCY